jgi:peptidoglycan-associated lipoprotein
MKKLLGLFAFVVLFSLPTLAQDKTPVLEVGGGYQYRSLDQPFAPRLNMDAGFFFTADYNINNWLGAAVEVDGTHTNQGLNGTFNDYGFMFGPQVYPVGHHHLTPFFHILFGGSHISVSVPAGPGGPAFTTSDTAFSFEGGGGVDWYLTKHVGVRVAELDYEQQRFFGANPVQHNYKFSAGFVVRLGEK